MKIPTRSLVVGNPAKIIREVSDEMIAWKTEGTALYQQLPSQCVETMRVCEPLTQLEENRPTHQQNYSIWKDKSIEK
jgi:predicted SPOUT superfamily RNA methylase MTH1